MAEADPWFENEFVDPLPDIDAENASASDGTDPEDEEVPVGPPDEKSGGVKL
jgi:hypothetical protein